MAWIGVVTDVGKRMLESVEVGGQMTITSVKLGSGSVPQVDMRAATDLTSYVTDGSLNSKLMETGVRLAVSIGPYTPTYTLKEVGVFAKLSGDTNSSLLCLYQEIDDGVNIPDATTFPDFVYVLYAMLITNNAEDITVEVDTSAVISRGELEEIIDGIEDELDLKAPKASPVFTWSISLGRKSGTSTGGSSIAVGMNVEASGAYSQAFGYETKASGSPSHAEGDSTHATGNYSHAEGKSTIASGPFTHAEGQNTTASVSRAHAEGYGSTASGERSHAEGYNTIASAVSSHAEGESTTASGVGSHAEGRNSVASGELGHAEGSGTTASGNASHAEGEGAEAKGNFSHAEGQATIANSNCSHAGGKYNSVRLEVATNYSEWTQNHIYSVGDLVKYTVRDTGLPNPPVLYCVCVEAHTSGNSFSNRCWKELSTNTPPSFAEFIGSGSISDRINIRALDWNGNEHISGRYYARAASDSSRGKVVGCICGIGAPSIPAEGSSVNVSAPDLTPDHVVLLWRFSSSPENRPPATLQIETYNGSYILTNIKGTTSESVNPIFVVPIP